MRGARGHKGCQNQNSKADYKIEKLMMIENLNQPDWTIWRQGPEGVKEGCYGAQNLTRTWQNQNDEIYLCTFCR